MTSKIHNWRIFILALGTILITLLIIWRLFFIQIINHNYYVELAQNQHELFVKLSPKRGQIFVTDLESDTWHLVAGNNDLGLLYLVPREIDDPDEVAQILSKEFDLKFEEVLAKASKKDDAYEPLKSKLSKEEVEKVNNLGLDGVRVDLESWRFYPEGEFAAHVLGFVGFAGDKKVGRYGVEGFYNDALEGVSGFVSEDRGISGAWISTSKREVKRAKAGSDFVLTIDRLIQFQVEEELKEAVLKWGATEGSIVVLDPKTGFILALANYPTFNPNTYFEVEKVDAFNNSVIFDTYEPGSIFKPIVMSIAIDNGVVSPFTTYVDTGSVRVDKYTISNFDYKTYGRQDMTNVLEKSINTGMVFVAQKMGVDIMYDGLLKFGFGKMTGISLDTEAKTSLRPKRKWRASNLATVSFGQGIAVTPLQIVAAMAAIANNGQLMAPQIVKTVIEYQDDGSFIEKQIEPKVVGQPIQPGTASTLSAMMVSVIDNGFGKPAKVAGYSIAGKTGTAEVPDKEKGGYDENKRITSFIGFAPYEDPRFVILIKLNLPRASDGGLQFVGSNTAAPVFKKLAKFIFDYYKIPPKGG